MTARVLTKNKRITIEVEGSNVKELFKNVAAAQDAFDAVHKCGMPGCGSEELRFQVRNVEDNDYYEVICLTCGAQFELGQHKKAPTLFPKRKEGHDGWSKYDPAKNGK